MSVSAKRLKRTASHWIARGYVAGPELGDAVRAAEVLAGRAFSTTLGYWDRPDETPAHAHETAIAAVEAVATARIAAYLSVKASALGFDEPLVVSIADAASARGVRVHYDAQAPRDADRNLALAEATQRRGAEVGYTLPGRWRRSLDDAETVVARGFAARVVKGEWLEENSPAPVGSAGRSGVMRVVESLAGRARHVGVATHDPVLARDALLTLMRAGTPAELELLLGFPPAPALAVARGLGIPARIYVPYGYAWLPYSLRDLRRDPRLVRWLLRDAARSRPLRAP